MAEAPLLALRGTLRDTLGAIKNLEQLLRSVRVGPKALRDVVPAVRASCEPLTAALELIATETSEAEAGCNTALAEFAIARVTELETALASVRGALRASQRLALESTVASVAGDLDKVLGLVDLRVDADQEGRVSIEIASLIRNGGSRRGGAAQYKVVATLAEAGAVAAIRASPRVASGLISIAAGLLGAGPDGAIKLTIEREGSICRLTVSPGETSGAAAELWASTPIPATEPCGRAIAAAMGGALRVADDGSVVMTFQASP